VANEPWTMRTVQKKPQCIRIPVNTPPSFASLQTVMSEKDAEPVALLTPVKFSS